MINEEKYSAYMTLQSNLVQVYAVLSGFMLTTIVLLLTMLPDPSQILVQITLFVLVFMLQIYLLLLDLKTYVLGRCVKVAPLMPKVTMRYLTGTNYIVVPLGNAIILLVILIWNLVYLALATLLAMIVLQVIHHLSVKPLMEHYRKEWIRK